MIVVAAVWNNSCMSTDPSDAVTMADLEQSDRTLAAQVRRARRKEDAERIMTLARKIQQVSTPPPAPASGAAAGSAPSTDGPAEPEPNWR